MKTALKLVGGLILLVLMEPAFSQDHSVAYNDPTYSTHNYKQANKAALAQQQEHNSGVGVQAVSTKDIQLSDYKPQMHQSLTDGGITVNYKSMVKAADWNYKTQHANTGTQARHGKHKHQHHKLA